MPRLRLGQLQHLGLRPDLNRTCIPMYTATQLSATAPTRLPMSLATCRRTPTHIPSVSEQVKIYKTILLCDMVANLTLREERKLRVFENRILWQIFGLKRDGNGEWKRLHSEELHII